MNGWLFFSITIVGVWRQSLEEILPLPRKSISACFGNTNGNYTILKPSCPAGERIVTDSVYAMSTPKNDSCPATMTTNDTYLFDKCCRYHEGHCKEKYHGAARINYFKELTGKQSEVIPASNQKIAADCILGNPSNLTNYMLLTFYCIKNSVIAGFDSNQPITAPAVYLANTEYPNTIQDGSSSVTCSVSVSCNSSILVTAIDLQLHNDSTTCTQTLDVIDGNNTKTFSCYNNQYNITTIYPSSSHFIKVVFKSTQNAGKLWIQFNATTFNANLTISCGSSVESSPPIVSACPSVSTTPTTPTTSTIETTPTTKTSSLVTGTTSTTKANETTSKMKATTKDSNTGLQSGTLAVIIVVTLCMLVAVTTGIFVYVKKIKKPKLDSGKGVKDSKEGSSSVLSNKNRVAPESVTPGNSTTCESTSNNIPPPFVLQNLPTGRGNSLPPLATQPAAVNTLNSIYVPRPKKLPPVEN